MPDVRAAVTLLAQLREASGDRVSSFELIPRIAVELTTRHIRGRERSARQAATTGTCCASCPSSRAAEPLDEVLEEALGAALDERHWCSMRR